MGTKQFNNYESLITFTRASGGHALRPVSYGDELVTNGDTFSSGWTTTGWTFPSEQASVTGNGTNQNLYGTPVSNAVTGKLYQLSYEVISSSLSGGEFRAGAFSGASFFGGSYLTLNTTVGTHALNFVGSPSGAGSVLDFWLTSGATSGTLVIDNISVKEVLFDQPDGTLTLFEHPENVPRVEWDSAGNRLGLLVEEQRTNLVTYSEDLSQGSQVNSPTITTNIATAPDGTETVDGIQDTSGGNFKRVRLFSGSVSANSTHTGSLFVKKETVETNYGGIVLSFTAGTANRAGYGIIDAVNGTISPATANNITATFTVTDVGDFWRFSITGTDTGSNTQLEFGVYGTLSVDGSTVGTGAGSVRRVWGAQVEQASFPTSYIKNQGTSSGVTRSADVASIPVADFGYNQSAFTVFIEASHLYDTFPTFNRFWELTGGGDTLGLYGNSITSSYVNLTVGGVQQITFGNGAADAADANTFMKYAVGLKTDDFDIARDGSLSAGDTSITMPDAIDTLDIGVSAGGGAQLNGHIKSIKYYPRRLTNAQLVDLTS